MKKRPETFKIKEIQLEALKIVEDIVILADLRDRIL